MQKNNRNVLTAKIAIAHNKHEHRGKKKLYRSKYLKAIIIFSNT